MIFGLVCVVLVGGAKVYVDMAAAGKPLPKRRQAPADPGWTYQPPNQ